MSVNDRAKNVLRLALCLFAVPILGWLTHLYLSGSYEKQFKQAILDAGKLSAQQYSEGGLSYHAFCAERKDMAPADAAGLAKICSFDEDADLLKLSVSMTTALGALLFLAIFGARFLAGRNRTRMAAVFEPLVRTVMVFLAISVAAQGALLIYCIFTLEAAAIQRVHTGILLAIGLGVLVVCLTLLRSAFSFFKNQDTVERAVLLDPQQEAGMYKFVNAIAQHLGAIAPDQIIIGLAPNFYVTAGAVNLPLSDKRLTGRTLYLSLPLLRILNKAEVAAVIGHELGHFRGEDTAYSMRFAPTYARLGAAIGAMSHSSGGAADLAKVPALAALTQCWLEFASAERTVGRQRELLADKAGAQASSAMNLAHALVKVTLYSPVWPHTEKQNIDLLAQGRMFNDLSATFTQTCAALPADFWDVHRSDLAQNVQAHPIDTHPPLRVRLENLGFGIDDIHSQTLQIPIESAASSLLTDASALGKELTIVEDQFLVAVKAVVVPDVEGAGHSA